MLGNVIQMGWGCFKNTYIYIYTSTQNITTKHNQNQKHPKPYCCCCCFPIKPLEAQKAMIEKTELQTLMFLFAVVALRPCCIACFDVSVCLLLV
jgi:ABC-type nickel/cobalt efflux system permease component RcnA